MARSFLMEADLDFDSFDFSNLECFSSSDTIFRDSFFCDNNEVNKVMDHNRQTHSTNNSSSSDEDDKDFFNKWNLSNFIVMPGEPVDFFKSENIKLEPEEVVEEIEIPSSPELEYSPTSEPQIEITTEDTSPLSPHSQIITLPQPIFLIEPVSSSNATRLLPIKPKTTSSGKCVTQGNKTVALNMIKKKRSVNNSSPFPTVSPKCNNKLKQNSKPCSVWDSNNIDVADIVNCKGINMNSLSFHQVQIIKRQLRMIKNRESANLSRKKKKDYVNSLEQKIEELQTENSTLKKENRELKDKLNQYMNNIAWIPKAKLGSTGKKVTTIMLGVVLMISFNMFKFGIFHQTEQNLYNNNNNLKVVGMLHHGRSLLWAKESDPYNSGEQLHSHSAIWSNDTSQMKCPLHMNQTESMRIDSELRKWMGAEKHPAKDNVTNIRPKVEVENKARLDISLPMLLNSAKRHQLYAKYSHSPSDVSENSVNGIQFFNLENERLFDDNEPLYQAMHRQRDTFYFVSFSEDHIILPAITHNVTISPKMSLVLPSSIINESIASSDGITMMQIDCAVTNTRLLRVKEKDIPPHFRTHSFKTHYKDNSSTYAKNVRNKLKALRSLHSSNHITKSFEINLPPNIKS